MANHKPVNNIADPKWEIQVGEIAFGLSPVKSFRSYIAVLWNPRRGETCVADDILVFGIGDDVKHVKTAVEDHKKLYALLWRC